MRALAIDRHTVVDWYLRNRARTRAIFDLIDPAAYYSRPIALRNPIVFYEGHLPAFSIISFLRRGLGRPPVDARLEKLFERGIDPDSAEAAVPRSGAGTMWPSRDEVLAFAERADEAIVQALEEAEFLEDRPAMQRAQALYTALEHEAMHQETLLYMWHRLPYAQKVRSNSWLPPLGGRTGDDLPPNRLRPDSLTLGRGYGESAVALAKAEGGSHKDSRSTVRIPTGTATLGADRERIAFGWDNEFDEHRVEVPAFEIDLDNVTNAQFMEFVEAGGYQTREFWSDENWQWLQAEKLTHPTFWAPERAREGTRVEGARPERAREGTRVEGWVWRGMFEDIPLPPDWPVYVSQAEASAYARWRNRRLPTEAEYHRAAFGTPSGVERSYPWGDVQPAPEHGNIDFERFEPVPVGSYPKGASAWGVHDLVGNGWEWTSTVFAPFGGFSPMASYPEYSADFFDGQHYVMKGGSPATAKELLRRSFRNWFRPNYPYVYATFRTVISG
jgi:formylglycine-generating enzyme required for sulfatase activity